MANVDYDQLNARLRKRLALVRQHQDPEEKFRLLKRYLSHFVKLVQIGRHFEASFAEHLRCVVIFLNDRRDKPLETDALGTIVKTLCVICCITAAPYQTVVIALQGLLEIFERISCKETLQVIQYCGNHFKKLLSQFRRFGYFKIQLQLVELAHSASLSFSKQNERKEFVLDLGRHIGGPLEQVLDWQSFALEQECRAFINGMQDKFPLFAAYSVPVEDAQIGLYQFMKPEDSNGLWLDVNFQPATIRFSARVTLIREKDSLEMTVYLEICHRDVSRIDLKKERNSCLLSIEYTKITVEPEVLTVDQKGCLTFTILPSFDCTYLTDDVLPEVRTNADRLEDSEQPCTTNLDGLLNVSLLDSIVSGPANSLNAHNMEDQSPRLRDNRDAIEKHRNIRCQMLDNTSSIGSNKENVKPPSISDVRVEVQDVQRLRVFETLQQDCQRQQTRLSRSSRRNSPDKCNQKNEPVNPRLNDGKKRKLFAKQAEPDNMNVSNDSQIQRSKYVDRKLVNTVKPIQTLDVKPLKLIQNIGEERIDLLSEPSTSEMMSNDEFDRSLQAFIDHNGIFGIAQQKILDTKLEKNIRKINQMVERTTKKFFKREPAPENPYDFVNTDDNDQTARKGGKSAAGKGKRKSPKTNDGHVSSVKKAKNVANQSLRTKNAKPTSSKKGKKQTSPKAADPLVPSRASLPRAKKPDRIIDLASDSEEEAVVIGNTFQNLDISSIVRDPAKPKNPVAQQLFAKSTPVGGAKSKKRSIDHIVDAQQKQEKVAKKQRVPLLEINANNSTIVTRRNYKKSSTPSALQQTAAALIEQEKYKAQSLQTSSSISDHSVRTEISMEFPGAHNQLPMEPPTLTEAMIRQYQSFDSDEPISQSLEVNPSPLPVPAVESQSKTNADVFASKFNMNYAANRYTLKKFISNNDPTYNSDEEVSPAHLATKLPNDGNESVLSENIRVGHDTANPPSLRDDSIDLQLSEGSVVLNEMQPPYYPATPKAQPVRFDCNNQKERKDSEKRANDMNSTKHVSTSGAGNQNKTNRSIVQAALFNNPPAMDAMMIDEFSAKLHQELNPSLSDFEQKVDKLAGMKAAFEPDLSGLHIKEINQKCVEIMSLEDRLDELLTELAELCNDAVEKSDRVTISADKLARYTESKANYYKERVQRARQEIPGIVDECVKSVWNQQVRIRLSQVELLMTKMLM
ncbi:uncharacterized protein LOC135714053 [Ochlerotatus camptorhynchus]|uniref:uncharacterized protein LOC135714053 n=1 Tax=Ochlerotatus camptorhynchus TaxID=644619 RepID=UPI0031D879D8